MVCNLCNMADGWRRGWCVPGETWLMAGGEEGMHLVTWLLVGGEDGILVHTLGVTWLMAGGEDGVRPV